LKWKGCLLIHKEWKMSKEEKEALEKKQRRIAMETQGKVIPKDTPREIKEYASRFKELYIERGSEAFTPKIAHDLLAEVLKKHGFKKEPKKKRAKGKKSYTGKTYLTKELSKYEETTLGLHRLFKKEMTEQFDVEERKDIVCFTKKSGDYIEEWRFDKDVVVYDGKEYIPSPKTMQKDLRYSAKLLMEKKQNPVSFLMKEKMIAVGFTEEALKKLGGREYKQIINAFIQLSTLRYMRWKRGPGGKKKILHIKSLSPYEEIWLPEHPGDEYAFLLRESYVRSLDSRTFQFKPGTFKELPAANPYRGKFIEERAFDFFEKDVKGRSLEIRTETLLRDKLRIQEQDLRRKGGRTIEYLDRCLTVAKSEGYHFDIDNTHRRGDGKIKETGKKTIIDYLKKRNLKEIMNILSLELKDRKIQVESLFGDCRKWKITFYSPIKSEHKLTDEGVLLALKITNWLHDPANDFRIRNPRERTEPQIKSFIQLLGYEAVEQAWTYAKEEVSLFEKTEDGQLINQATSFWQELKKRKRAKYASSKVNSK